MSITISSGAPIGTRPIHAGSETHRPGTTAGLRTTSRPLAESESFGRIGDLKRAISGNNLRDARLTRGERYAALTHYALSKRSPQIAEEFMMRLERNLRMSRREDLGERFMRATDRAVRELVREGLMTKGEVRTIQEEALNDGKTRRNSTSPLESDATTIRAPHADIFSASAPSYKGPTTSIDAPVGFLWKPFSDSDGLLAILLPVEWTSDATKVEVLSPDGKTVLAQGRPSGIGNGGRAHFRFDRPGSEFPAGSIVRVHRGDGSTHDIAVSQPGMRNEGSPR